MNSSGILHIAQDEKFINSAHHQFNRVFPGENRFVIIKPQGNPPDRYLDPELDVEIKLESKTIADELVELSRQHEVVVFHGINRLKGSVFLKSAEKHKFMGILFGAEIYNEEVMGAEYLGEKTKKLEESLQKTTLLDIIKRVYRKARYNHTGELYADVDLRGAIYTMDVLGTLPGYSRQNLMDKGIFRDSVKTVPFTYYPLELIIRERGLRAAGPDILLGNSASETNNHLEAFDFLKELNLDGRKVFTPLSYGSARYARAIESHGRQILGGNFEALTEYLPLSGYNKILSRCGVVIMNHYRSQAMGNLIASLYLGARVYVNDTDAYQYFKKLGCHIYLIEMDLLQAEQGLELLSDRQVEHNRKILESVFSIDILAEKLKNSFREVFHYG